MEDRLPVPSPQLTEKEIATKKLLNRLKVNPANYTNLQFTPEEVTRITRYMSGLSTGSTAAMPLLCTGSGCPFAQSCVFQQMGKAPIGQPCIVEVQLLQVWRESYILEYDIDPDSMTELTFINELAEIELMLYRLNLNLAKVGNAELVQEETVAVDREGNVLTRRTVSAFMEAKEKLANRKAKIVKLMVGDRQEKYKKDAALKVRNEADASLQGANLRRELQSLIAAASEASARQLLAANQVETAQKTSSSPSGPQEGKKDTSRTIQAITPEDLISDMLEGKTSNSGD